MKYTISRFLKTKSAIEILGANYAPSPIQIIRFDYLMAHYAITKIAEWKKAISYFIKFDLNNYYGRLRRLLPLGSKNTKYAYVLRYGKVEGIKRTEKHLRLAKENLANTIEYWTSRGCSVDQAESKRIEVQTNRSHKSAEVTRGSSEHSVRTIGYWRKQGLSEEEAAIQVTRVQQRHHTIERNERWQQTLNSKPIEEQRLINSKKSNSIEGIMCRGFSLEEATERNRLIFEGRKPTAFSPVSKISQKMFEMIAARIGETDLYFHNLNYEKNIRGKMVDFYDHQTGIVIEYLGDWFHSNPMTYPGSFQHRTGHYAANIRLDDARRTFRILEDPRVKNVYYVWDTEFRTNPTEVVNLIVEFLLEERSEMNKKIDNSK